MKPAENIKRLIKNLHDTTDPEMDKRILNDTLNALEQTTSAKHKPNFRRIIMNRPITKLATAAVVILAVIFGVTVLDRLTAPVWAIEDTARALDQFNGIYVSGVVGTPIAEFGGGEDLVLREETKMTVEIWAQANEQRTRSGNIRMETGDGAIGAVYNNTTYRYDPNNNTVQVQGGQGVCLSPWPSGEFLHKAKEFMEDWQVLYGKDAATGRDYAFITCVNPSQGQSWWLEIDLETDLLVRAKGWNNTRREGAPSMDFQRIVFFEELPDEMFEYEMPEGAKVVDSREQFKQILQNSSYGMSVEGLTKEEACKEIVSRYWQAMINEAWEDAQKVRGIADESTWEDWKAQYYDNMPAEIIEIKQPYDEKGWTTTPMVIKMVDGSIKQGKLMVKFYELNDVEWCIIMGNYGPRELNDVK